MDSVNFLCLVYAITVLILPRESQGTKNSVSHIIRSHITQSPPIFRFFKSKSDQCLIDSRACIFKKYRSIDGSCNNLKNPTWGSSNTPFRRLSSPNYSDGIGQPPLSVTGSLLPSARILSLVLFSDNKTDDYIWTLLTMNWGQIVAHDTSYSSGTSLPAQRAAMCCGLDLTCLGARDKQDNSQKCFPISLPLNDPLTGNLSHPCLSFARTHTEEKSECPGKPKYIDQLNVVTHWLDGSFIYGSDDKTAQSIREFSNGKLRSEKRRKKDWLPQNENRNKVCEGNAQWGGGSCYTSGDGRVNQNPQLAILQTIFLREHNRIACKLQSMNPHWNDEILYQEARRIVIAEFQYITYYEWLPILLGYENLIKQGVLYDSKKAYINDYNEEEDPRITNEFATAAYRVFHNTIQGYLHMVTKTQDVSQVLRLSDHFNDPSVIEQNNGFDDLIRGFTSQPQGKADRFLTSEITDFLFRNKQVIGFDLMAFDIQRGRDHGLPSYNHMRQFCGFKKAFDFEDFGDFIEPNLVHQLKKLYEHPDDVDLMVGGALETNKPETLAGPTFLCILTKQFYSTRLGDKYFFEHGDYEGAFSPDQLKEIRKASAARLLCDNGNDITAMQPQAFKDFGYGNQVELCKDIKSIPAINLNYWKDDKRKNLMLFN